LVLGTLLIYYDTMSYRSKLMLNMLHSMLVEKYTFKEKPIQN